MKTEMNDAYKRIHWDNDKQGYFFWDEAETYQIGYWPTKEQAEIELEKYESSSNIRVL